MKCSNCHRASEKPICNSCWTFAISQLHKFPMRYKQLETELLPSKVVSGDKIQTSSSQPAPVRLETLALRSGEISKLLMSYESAIRELRKETKITFRGDELNRITKTCVYLIDRAEWIRAYFDDAPELALSIIRIANRINFVLGYKSEEMVIGKCPAQDGEGNICNAKLKINPQALDQNPTIRCRRCDTTWDSTQWRLLGSILQEENEVNK